MNPNHQFYQSQLGLYTELLKTAPRPDRVRVIIEAYQEELGQKRLE